jgi:hypothetical protein
MKLIVIPFRPQLIKAVVRRMIVLDRQSAYAAHADAGFDAGEWSSPAHDQMLDKAQDALLMRLRGPERDIAEEAYRAQMYLSGPELRGWYIQRGLSKPVGPCPCCGVVLPESEHCVTVEIC